MNLSTVETEITRAGGQLRMAEDCLARLRDTLEGGMSHVSIDYADRQADKATWYVHAAHLILAELSAALIQVQCVTVTRDNPEALDTFDVRYPYVSALLQKLREQKP